MMSTSSDFYWSFWSEIDTILNSNNEIDYMYCTDFNMKRVDKHCESKFFLIEIDI